MQYYHFKNIQSALRIKKKKSNNKNPYLVFVHQSSMPVHTKGPPPARSGLNACSHQRSSTSKHTMALPPPLFLSRECEDSSSKGALHFYRSCTLLHLPSCCPHLSGDTCSITAQIMCGNR